MSCKFQKTLIMICTMYMYSLTIIVVQREVEVNWDVMQSSVE